MIGAVIPHTSDAVRAKVIDACAGHATIDELAQLLGVDKSTISRALKPWVKEVVNTLQAQATEGQAHATECNRLNAQVQQLETEKAQLATRRDEYIAKYNDVQEGKESLQTQLDDQIKENSTLAATVNTLQQKEGKWKGQNRVTQAIGSGEAITLWAICVAVFDYWALSHLLLAGLGPVVSHVVAVALAMMVLSFTVRGNDGSRQFAIVVSFVAASLHFDLLPSLAHVVSDLSKFSLPQKPDMVGIFFSLCPPAANHRLTQELKIK